MARYDLPQYQSMYRDPQSVKINTALRQRYVENFAGADALQGAVDDMTSADFEGDKLEKQKLVDKYNAELNEMSSQGDYESMGMRVANNARDFVQDYKPVQQNKAKYDAYIAELDRLRKAGIDGGGISEFVYKRKIAESKHGYTGLQRDEEGKIDEDSYFSGPGVVKSVDYIKVLDDALTGIKPSAASQVFDIPQHMLRVDPKNGTVQLVQFPKGGKMAYKVETTDGWKEVSADRVYRVVQDVLNDPSVQMSLEQDAHLSTFDMSLEDAKTKVDDEIVKINQNILDITNKEGIYKNYSDEEIEKLLKDKNTYKDEFLKLREDEGDIYLSRSIEKNNITNRALDASYAKHVYRETEIKRLIERDPLDVHGKKQSTTEVPVASTFVAHPPINQLGGTTASNKLEFIKDTQEAINLGIDNLFNKGEINEDDNNLTTLSNGEVIDKETILDEILKIQNNDDYIELAKKYDYGDVDQFKEVANAIIRNTMNKRIVQQKIEEAKTEIFSENYDQDISEEYAGPTHLKEDDFYNVSLNGQDIKNALVAAGVIDGNSSVKDAMDYMLDISGGFQGSTARSANLLLHTFGDNTDAIMEAIFNLSGVDGVYVPTHEKIDPENLENKAVHKTDVKHQGALNYLVVDLVKDYGKKMKEDLKKLNDVFKVQVQTDGMKMNWFGDKENTKAVQQTLQTIFDKMIPPSFTVIHPETHEEIQMKEYIAKILGGSSEYEIDKKNVGMMNVPRADGELMIIVPITMQNGNQVNITMPARNIKSDEINDWTKSAEYKVQQIFNQGRWANLKVLEPIEYFEGVKFDYTDPTDEKVFIMEDHDKDPSTPMKYQEYSKEVGLDKLALVFANAKFADMFLEGKLKRLNNQ